jgi:hypothetical protein
MWLGAALFATATLSFWAGMRVERKRSELQIGMTATMAAIDHDRAARAKTDCHDEDAEVQD